MCVCVCEVSCHVCVSGNQITDAGAASLAEAIKSCTQLDILILDGARVRVAGDDLRAQGPLHRIVDAFLVLATEILPVLH